MTAERFNSKALHEQCYYTAKCGVYLASFNDKEVSIDLFQIDSFYVEMFYLNGASQCCYAKAWNHTNCLNKYLKQISIAGLF